ncbi:MAG: aminopeptidase P family protein [Defluviitaleaceae bacterium]|nr:aminopeptidase P family protein [Defluviitaleaceae bacterium]
MTTHEKIAALRTLMKERNLDAYLLPSGDAHASEYIAPYWKARPWFSGFTGSNGTVVITPTDVGLWTDGRYFIQAENQLQGSGIGLYKMEMPGVPKYREFLADKIPQGGKLGFDGRVVTVKDYRKICNALKDKAVTYAYNEDLIDLIWKDRPALPTEKAFEHELQFAGATAAEKLAAVREQMTKHDISAYLVTALDSIAWLANIRGRDISYTPVVYAYALITPDEAHLFISKDKIASFSTNLTAQGFTLHDYDKLTDYIKALPANGDLLFDPEKTNVLISDALPENIPVKKDLETDIITLLKAVKSPVELENTRNAYIKESVALVRLLKWLEEHPDISTLTEGDVARKITSLRQEQADFLEDGFTTIAAYMANAAQAHYSPGPVGSKLKPDGFLLVDTGGQYLDGTTDTTRTIVIGPISAEMKRNFTLVLKGHIAISQAVFPEGSSGVQLDSLARLALWEHGLDFRHGTGHGIGFCLGVHEGPQGISKRSKVALEPGMLLSNEPGFYKDGEYGIRTENIIAVEKRAETEYGVFFGFETLTYCPYDTAAIDVSLLTPAEIKYLNDYHAKTYEVLAPRLDEGEKEWLSNATQPLK